MDLKIWLRYQLSGSVYIAWLLIFYYSSNSYDLIEVTSKIFSLDVVKIFAAGIPTGAIIHQFSVSFKNQVLGGWFGLQFFQDSMVDDSTLTNFIIRRMGNNQMVLRSNRFVRIISGKKPRRGRVGDIGSDIIDSKIRATHEKLSALNTFYYMRVDNGFFAPILAFISYVLVIASTYDDLPWMTFVIVFIVVLTIVLVKIGSMILIYAKTKHSSRLVKFSKIHYAFISVLIMLLSAMMYCLCKISPSYQFDYKRYFYPEQQIAIIQTNESSSFIDKTQQIIIEASENNPNLVFESKEIYEYQRNEPLNAILNDKSILEKSSPDVSDVNYVIYNKDGKKYEIKRINKHLLPSVITLCLLYMLALLSYIPIIYFERRDTWNLYVR